jgi:pimeloyl-ACP methyl ester carboxylesterase
MNTVALKKLLKVCLAIVFVASMCACASIPGSQIDTIDGKKIEYVVAQHNTRTVVFENGLGGTLDWWAKVYPELSKDQTAIVYNRPGYGNSDPATTPRDGDHIVEELRVLLKSKRLRSPYVLVGHSLGGLYMQLYARKYPAEVSALVLVDSTHPEQMKGRGAQANWSSWVRLVVNLALSAVAKEELQAVNATGEQVLALPALTTVPVWLLSAKKEQDAQADSDLARDSQAKRQDLQRLYPSAKVVWVDSGHGIPLENPDAVIAAIREAVR